MRNLLFSLTLVTLFFLSCDNEPSPFEIGKQHIGLLTDSTQVKDLKLIFSSDSISKFEAGDQFEGDINTIEIFDVDGNRLLVLTPKLPLDSTSTIKNVHIIDPRYKTSKNISTASTFQDINKAYEISKINNLINSVVVSVKELNASFTIDKKELPANLRFDRDLQIEEAHIPDNAKIKYFFLNWNYN